MPAKTYTRLQLAADQLYAAVCLFITHRDRFSVITLAGTADVILSRLVLNTGQENFTDSIIKMEVEKGEQGRTRAETGKAVNDMLLINALKHFDENDSGIVEVDDLEECAFAAILKAMANYVALAGRNEDWVRAFFLWVSKNMDPAKYNVNCDPNWIAPTPDS
ncbi:hypothetical protein K6V90_24465 [Cupriavidus pauculus]|uniref:hypothetical protein n=1 Tax=Cupriavidus pauculus TaxID=82633 RepID=UPI001C9331B8|nr:hypothetical protein [Cupriavidus pauculus]MBY4733695.1 hypothetical protein [Cupriavidus pauculus]